MILSLYFHLCQPPIALCWDWMASGAVSFTTTRRRPQDVFSDGLSHVESEFEFQRVNLLIYGLWSITSHLASWLAGWPTDLLVVKTTKQLNNNSRGLKIAVILMPSRRVYYNRFHFETYYLLPINRLLFGWLVVVVTAHSCNSFYCVATSQQHL